MNGVLIQYLLGIYFFITSITFTNGKFTADAFRLIASLILIVLAILGFSLVR